MGSVLDDDGVLQDSRKGIVDVFARFYDLKSLMQCSAAAANVAKSLLALWPTAAKAHAVIARDCELNSLIQQLQLQQSKSNSQ